MPSFMKDELKKKDEEKLEEMKREIDEAEAADAAEDVCLLITSTHSSTAY